MLTPLFLNVPIEFIMYLIHQSYLSCLFNLILSPYIVFVMVLMLNSIFRLNSDILLSNGQQYQSMISGIFIYSVFISSSVLVTESVQFFSHLTLNSHTLSIFNLTLLFLVFVFTLNSKSFFISTQESLDYLSALAIFINWSCFIVLSNNLLSFIFFIELINTISLLVLISNYANSSFFYNNNSSNVSYSQISIYSLTLISVIIIFWISLIASILLFLSLLYFYSSMVSVDTTLVNFIFSYELITIDSSSYKPSILFCLGVFIKLGLPPVFLWNINFFRNSNLSFAVFYIFNLYFVVFIAFMDIYSNLIFVINYNISTLISAFFLTGILFSSSIAFNNLNLNVFLALSSSLNLLFLLYVLNISNPSDLLGSI